MRSLWCLICGLLVVTLCSATGRPGEECEPDGTCFPPRTTVCDVMTNLCICKDGFSEFYHACNPNPGLGEICYQCFGVGSDLCYNMKCKTTNSKCHEKTDVCVCEDGYTNEADECKQAEQSREIGESCEATVNCKGPLVNCIDKKCACSADAVLNAEKNLCVKKISGLEEECEVAEQCQLPSSTCRSEESSGIKMCLCKADLVTNIDKTKCLEKVSLGATCEDDSQCADVINSACRSEENDGIKMCLCKLDFISNTGKTKCLEKVSFEMECEDDSQCTTPNSTCRSSEEIKMCLCNPGLVTNIDKTKCLEKVGHEGECEDDSQCTIPNSRCLLKECACESAFVTSENKESCLLKRGLNETCQESKQCTAVVENSWCDVNNSNTNKCSCLDGFQEVDRRCKDPNGDNSNSASRDRLIFESLCLAMIGLTFVF